MISAAMAMPNPSTTSISSMWEVFVLFAIPVGGGIPGGVLLAKSRNLGWPIMMILYFFSDVALAFVFEPLMLLVIAGAKRSPAVNRMRLAMRNYLDKTMSRYGAKLGPRALIMLSFGVDPMTGRAASVAAGHGFLIGWLLAITGDMIFFTLLMASTLWLNGILGDGTAATIIILVVMMIVPNLLRRFHERRLTPKP
jgi:hypothetical protein